MVSTSSDSDIVYRVFSYPIISL